MLHRTCHLAVLLTCLLQSVHAAEPLRLPISDTLETALTLETQPPAGKWESPVAAYAGDGYLASSENGSILHITRSGDSYRMELSRRDGGSFLVKDFQIRVRLPLAGVAGVWDTQVPPFGSLFRRVPEVDYKLETRAQVGIPAVTLVDAYGNNRLTAGFVEQGQTCEFTCGRSGYSYDLLLRRLTGDADTPAASFAITAYLDETAGYWFDAVRSYAAAVDASQQYRPRATPAWAKEAQYSTRYPFGEKIDQEIVLGNALLAKEMGAREILIDVGWSTEKGWADSSGDYGDYVPARSKFSDFRGLVRRLHSEGLKVTLWVAPTWIGREAASFEKIKDYRVKFPGGDYDRNICPRTPEGRAFIAESLARAAKDYGVDGFWMDFVDTFLSTCEAPHSHDIADFGEAVSRMAQEIHQAVTKVRPDAVLEYRIPYANLLFKPHANVFETTWSPEDFRANRLMGTFLRAYSGGVQTKADPAYWADAQDHEDIGRHMMTSLFVGPPTFSGDLVKMSEERRTQVAKWIDYYRANREDILGGEFAPFGPLFHNPDLKIVSERKAFVYLSTKGSRVIPIQKPVSELHILNSNPPTQGQLRFVVEGMPDGRYNGKYFDCALKSDRDEPFECRDGRMAVSTDMPTGGVLVLTRVGD